MKKIGFGLMIIVFILNGYVFPQAAAPVYGSNTKAGKHIKIDDINMYYETYGKGEPLLLLHPNGESIEAFSKQIPELQKHFMVIAVDLRAHGRTTDSDKELTDTLMANDIKLLLDALKLNAVNLVGWSDGGVIGMRLALDFPQKIKKLVLIGANYEPAGYQPAFISMISMADYQMLPPKTREKKAAISPNPQRDALVFKKQMNLMLKYPHIKPEELANIKIPVMVMAGDHDLIREEHTIKLFQSLPNSYLGIIPGASHIAPFEKSELVNPIIINFLKRPYAEINRYYFLME